MDSAESLESTDNSIAIHSDQDASEKQTVDCDVPSQKGTEAHPTLCEGSSVPKQNTPNLNEIEQEPSQVTQPTCEENFISTVTNSNLEQCKNGKTSNQDESEQGGSMPDPVEESLSKGSMLHCAEEELASHKTSESNLDGASDNLKTDKETERTLQIEATVSLSDKSIKEVVSDSETNAAINSILEQPSENVETQLTAEEIRSKNQLQPIDTVVNECATALNAEGEEGSGQTCSAGLLPEKRYIIMEDEDDIRVLSVDSLLERGGDKISSQEAANQTVCSLKENANITVKVDDKSLTSTPLIENNNTSVISKIPASQERHQKSNSAGITELEQTNMDNRAKLTSPDGEEELCIVPDTEPRIPTDQEKADACEKANKTSSVADEASDKVDEKQKSDSVVLSGKTCSQKIGTGKGEEMEGGIEAEPGSATTTQKFGIQLVSTSSLISRQESVGKVHDQADFLLCSTPQDGIEIEDSGENTCGGCGKLAKCKYHLKLKGLHLCGDECYKVYRKANDPPPPPHPPKVTIRPRKLDKSYVHKCGQCLKKVDIKLEKSLTWETMDFCSDDCLERYQLSFGSHCANCKKKVQSSSLGKYCVRFGYDMKQFCDARCLEDFKKGLKVCSYCQKDISADTEGFLAPVGDKGQFKDFCSQECMEKYDQMSHNTVPPEMTHECAVCNISKPVKVEVLIDSKVQKLCSEPCFAAFKFANSVVADQCDMCKKYYDHNRTENFTVYYDEAPHRFCCKTCMNVYILAKRKIVPCSHCKVKKYNFDMIKKTMSNGHGVMMMCSLHCLHLYGSSSASHSVPKKNGCEFCGSNSPTLYHLSMSDASVRNFCSPNCVASFQEKFQSKSASDKTPYPLGTPRKIFPKKISTIDDNDQVSSNSAAMPVISSVTSLAPSPGAVPPLSAAPAPSPSAVKKPKESETILKTVYKQHYIVKPPVHPKMKNCAVQVTPKTVSKTVSCHPDTCSVGTQTDDPISKPLFIPVPIPVFIPTPMHMYTSPYPVPVPIALPIPVPIFIPTTRNSSKGIFKEIKRIQEKIPSDPYEAELLMMAELVADDKRVENTDTDSEDCEDKTEDIDSGNTAEADYSPETVTNNTFGNDVLQMALKMASEYDEPAAELTPAASDTLQQTPSKSSNVDGKKGSEDDTEETEHNATSARKRPLCQTSDNPQCAKSKRLRKSSASDLVPVKSEAHVDLITPKVEPTEKPDAHMCLKFTLGVNAWKNWLLHKNEELVKAGGTSKNLKLKQDIIQLTADELNYSLCLFVKEVVNPNGQEYAPDTIYYLCLGIQQYLVENGRTENIFCDPNYEKFTTCLDEIVKKFSNFNVDANILVTRIEEEHLWESKQLGAHSPYVLLNTLIYFNTKHFNLMTVEEHMQLSFSHIMKHWKRPPNTVGPLKPGSSRNVLLRFYPPQSALDANSKKKKVYEQQENENNPLRCPVKLYEFYLSKCPESVKTRNDVFYLLPERSCVPESPVWYSTMALGHEQLQKMLNRISLVKEIVML